MFESDLFWSTISKREKYQYEKTLAISICLLE